MELFKLLGTIAIENAEAKKALQETSQEGEKTESKLSKSFSAIGKGAAAVGKAIASGLAVGAAAMTGLTVKALQLSGDLEQNLGGAEAVFGDLGDSIDKMSTKVITGYDEATGKAIYATTNLEKVSKDAYKNMGLSQSDYLATANKMGALFQGAGFETQEALDLSSQAMQRAADVASIMGLDTEDAMEAIAGAAKGNFTMMDNLGVAMNDTAIQNYALAKGINKSTSEMTQQEKIALAMEMFMEETAYAAGNYAKENETLAGSLGTAKAALTNFLSGSGDVESLVSSFSGLANVVVKSLGEIVPRLTTGLTDVVNQVAPMLPGLLNSLLPVIIQGATALVNGLVTALPGIVSAITTALPMLIEGVATIIVGIAQALPQMVQTIVAALPQVIQAIVDALPTIIPALHAGMTQVFVAIVSALPQIIQPIIEALPTIIISIVEALVQNLPAIIEGLITLIMAIVTAIPQIIQALIDALPTVISLLTEALLMNLPVIIMGLIQVVLGIVTALPQIFGSLIAAVPAALSGIWDGIAKVFGNIGEWFGKLFGDAWKNIQKAWSSVVSWFSNIWKGISGAFSAVASWFSNIFSSAWKGIQSAWSGATNFFKNIWKGITNIFKVAASWFSSTVVKPITGFFTDMWSGITDAAGKAWEGIKSVFSSVASFFKNIFTNAWNGVKAVFSTGGKIFDGIKEGIVTTFKTVVNGIIKGINKVVALPFEGLNKILDRIHGISIVGVKPFSWLKWRAPVPQLPMLAEGGIVGDATTAIVGENGEEAIVPLEKNTRGIEKIAQKLSENMNINQEQAKVIVLDLFTWLGNGFKKGVAKISDFGQKVCTTIMDAFGIQGQKSQVMYGEVGLALAEGVASGLSDSKSVDQATEEMSKKVLDAAQKRLDDYKVYNALTLADEVAFWDKVRTQVKEGTDARIQADQKYFEAKNSFNEKLLEAEKNLQTKLDDTYTKVDDRAKEIASNFGLFETASIDQTDGDQMFYAMYSQVEALEQYQAEMGKLEEKIGDTELFKELQSMGVGALKQIKELNSLSDYSLNYYLDMYNKRNDLAKSIANDELADETAAATATAFEEYAETLAGLGVEIVDETAIMKVGGINNMKEMLAEFTKSLSEFSPKMKIPHFKISGTLDIAQGSVPTVSVEWYKKAMNNAMLLDKPTIFGFNNASGKLMGAGEAGSEVVAGSTTLMNMIQNAVAEQNGTLSYYLQKIVELLATFFPEQIEAFRNMKLRLNTGTLVGELVVPMNEALGILSEREDRWK